MYPSHKPPSIPHLFQVGAHSEFGQVMYCWIMEIMQIHIEKRVLINILADLGIFSQFSLKFWEYDKFSKYCRVAYHWIRNFMLNFFLILRNSSPKS